MVYNSWRLAWITSTALLSGEDNTFPQGFRGRWENQDTFVVEDILLGQMVQVYTASSFPGMPSTSPARRSVPGAKSRYKAR